MAGAYDAALLARALPMMMQASPGLLAGGTYFVAEIDDTVVGCGGWSVGQPGTGAVELGVAHIRHFATGQPWIGRGVGRVIYARCETTARAAGMRQFQCYASRNGEAFYASLGFYRIAAIQVPMGADLTFPSIHMGRRI